MKMIWSGWKNKENCHVLESQFHGNFHSKTLSCSKIKTVFRDVKWCFNASWGLKGLIKFKNRRCAGKLHGKYGKSVTWVQKQRMQYQGTYARTSYDISQAWDWPRWTSRPISSLRYIVTCTRIRAQSCQRHAVTAFWIARAQKRRWHIRKTLFQKLSSLWAFLKPELFIKPFSWLCTASNMFTSIWISLKLSIILLDA